MLANTTSIRAWLPGLLQELKIGTLLDVPCGDFNWMSLTDLSGVDYVGGDYDKEHCERALSRASDPYSFSPRSKLVIPLDIVNYDLPRAELMLCREFLQHLPTVQVVRVIRNYIDSGISWLLVTSHDNAINFDIEVAGMFRPLNLMLPPFWWTAPRQSVEDQPGSGRILGLWHRSDIIGQRN